MNSRPWDVDFTLYDDEASLLDALRRKERMACTCLLKRYAPRLYRLALHLMGNVDEAEEVLQESFIQACAHVSDFEGRSALGTWLHRIMRNTALMRLRRRRLNVVHLDEAGGIGNGRVSEALVATRGPGQEVLALELWKQVEQALLDLPDSLRAAFVLREIEGMDTQEAAAALGISLSALKVRLHRARLALRESLAPYVRAEMAGDEEGDEG